MKFVQNHMISIRTCQEENSVLMKVIEGWSPCFPDVILLEKGRPFGYSKEKWKG
jgi:hypothetical protein